MGQKSCPDFWIFFKILLYYIYAREHEQLRYQKKHQDMEVNNIQETQHRDAQQMRVDEFAAMLGQVQKPRDV